MINILLTRITLYPYAILPYTAAVMGVLASVILSYFSLYSKSRIFQYLVAIFLTMSFYNFVVGQHFSITTRVHAILHFKMLLIAPILIIPLFLLVTYQLIERRFDKYIVISIVISLVFMIMNFAGLFIHEIFLKYGQYKIKPSVFLIFYIIFGYVVFLYSILILIKNYRTIDANINIPIFMKYFLVGVIPIFVFSIGDLFNITGIANLPPLLSLGFIIYILVLLFNIMKNNIIYYELLKRNYLQTITGLADLMDNKDNYTYRHSYRVAKYATYLAKKLNFDKDTIECINKASLLHDIGKIGIPDDILLKKGKLNEEEWQLIKTHSENGALILGIVDFLKREADIIRHHHERYDGKGYPEGLSKEDIPLEVQVVSISDTFDAMTSARPYRRKFPLKVVYKELKRVKGQQFSAEIVDNFMECWNNIVDLYKKFEHQDKKR
ncbi:MAG: HD domain-containing protein [Spirochaetes bacterium]|nr:HD domain-containing protein [Spirochaetota bacterium]